MRQTFEMIRRVRITTAAARTFRLFGTAFASGLLTRIDDIPRSIPGANRSAPSRLSFILLAGFAFAGCLRGTEPINTGEFDILDHWDQVRVTIEDGEAGEVEAGTGQLVFSEDFEDPSAFEGRFFCGKGRAEGGIAEGAGIEGGNAFAMFDVIEPGPGGPSGAEAGVLWEIDAEPNTVYRLRGYVRTDSLTALDAQFHGSFYLAEYQRDKDNPSVINDTPRVHRELTSHQGDTEGWRPVEYTLLTASHAARISIIACFAGWGRATGRVLFDQISLEKLPPAGAVILDDGPRIGRYRSQRETRRAVAVPAPSIIEYRARINRDQALDLAIAVPDAARNTARSRVRFQVTLAAADGETATLFDRAIESASGWIEARIGLSAHVGEEVRLRLEAEPVGGSAGPVAVLWGHPRLIDLERTRRPKSVIFVSIDTLRADHVSHLGHPRPTTPALDRLARQGVSFLQAESAAPWTLPSHSAMLTATFPHYHFGEATDQYTRLGDGLLTVPEILRERGYFCGAFTTHINVSETYGLDQGFDTFDYQQDIRADIVIDRAIDWLERHGTRSTFLFLHLFDPHADYDPPEPYDRIYNPDYAGEFTGEYRRFVMPYLDLDKRPANPDLDQLLALYDGEIRYADVHIERLINALAELSLDQRTLVVITSDHGEEFNEHGSMTHGMTLFEEVLAVPVIFWSPGRFGRERLPLNRVIAEPVRTIDILPTVMDLIGISLDPLPQGAGVSLSPLINGETLTAPMPILAKTMKTGNPQDAYRLGDDKLIFQRLTRAAMVFDLGEDPGERRNRADADPFRAMTMLRALQQEANRLETLANDIPGLRSEQIALEDEQEELLRNMGYIE